MRSEKTTYQGRWIGLLLCKGSLLLCLFGMPTLWGQDDDEGEDDRTQSLVKGGVDTFLDLTDDLLVNDAIRGIAFMSSMGSLFSADYGLFNVSIRLPVSMVIIPRVEGDVTQFLDRLEGAIDTLELDDTIEEYAEFMDNLPNVALNFQGEVRVKIGAFFSTIPVLRDLELGLRGHYWALPLTWVPLGLGDFSQNTLNVNVSGWGLTPVVRTHFYRVSVLQFSAGLGLNTDYATLSHEHLWKSYALGNDDEISIDMRITNHLLTIAPEATLGMEVDLGLLKILLGTSALMPSYRVTEDSGQSLDVEYTSSPQDSATTRETYSVELPSRLPSLQNVEDFNSFILKGMLGVSLFGMEAHVEGTLEGHYAFGLYYTLRL